MKVIGSVLSAATKTTDMESALSVALKTKKTVRICDECGTPLIWTFAFPYAERFCLNCGTKGGMLGAGKCVAITRDLAFKKKLVDSIWRVVYSKKGLLPTGSFSRSGCKKDGGTCLEHRNHLSESEKEWDEIARKHLEAFLGVFNRIN